MLNGTVESTDVDTGQLAFCRALPKVELHAHVNGSLSDASVLRLVHERGQAAGITERDVEDIMSKKHRTLADCFRLFDVIHRLTTDHATITRIAEEVVIDFANDGVVWLELRTSPKVRPELGMTKASYTQAVLDGIQKAVASLSSGGRSITVKLLLSIDRREGSEAAMDTVGAWAGVHVSDYDPSPLRKYHVQLASSLRSGGVVVGIDLSGNPVVGSWSSWEPALAAAKAAGLKVTLHGGEINNDEEVEAMLRFRPDRLGHMCCMGPKCEADLLASRIPVELCLTSNIKTQTFDGFDKHHFRSLHARGHPVVLCTDDSGVFGTTLSREYAIAMRTFGLSEADMKQLVTSSVEYAFVSSEQEREQLRTLVSNAFS